MKRFIQNITTGFISALVFVMIVNIILLAPVAHAQGSNYVVVNTGAVHIRSGPSPYMTSLGTVAGGTELAVTGRNAGTTWWRVDSPFGVGWVSDYYVAFRGNLDAVPVVDQPAGTLAPATVIVDRYPATVYSNPDADSFVVGISPTNAVLTVTGISADGKWWQVMTTAGPGWVSVNEVALRGDVSMIPVAGDPGPSFNGPTIRVNSDTTVSSQPGGGDTIATLPAGAMVPAVGRTSDITWWQVTDGWIGWIPVQDVSLAGSVDNIRVVAQGSATGPASTGAVVARALVEVDRKIAYAEDSYGSAPMWDARLGEELGVIARSTNGSWLKVTKDRYEGWMNFSGLTLFGSLASLPVIDTTPVIANVAVVNIHRLNIRSGPGAEYQALTSVPGGTTLSVTGRHPSLPWLRVQGDFGVGWVRILYIIFRGVWSAVPVVTEPVGALEAPLAIVNYPHHVYTQPSWEVQAGSIEGGLYPIVGRSANGQWVLIDTSLGQVWISLSEIEIRGLIGNAPVIG